MSSCTVASEVGSRGVVGRDDVFKSLVRPFIALLLREELVESVLLRGINSVELVMLGEWVRCAPDEGTERESDEARNKVGSIV